MKNTNQFVIPIVEFVGDNPHIRYGTPFIVTGCNEGVYSLIASRWYDVYHDTEKIKELFLVGRIDLKVCSAEYEEYFPLDSVLILGA